MRGNWPLVAGGLMGLAIMAGVVAMMQTSTRRAPTATQTAAPTRPAPTAPDIILTGTIQARKTVSLSPTTDGVIERFMADAGEDVFEGELLATIKNPKLATRSQATESAAVQARALASDLEAALIAARLEASRARSDATRTKAELERAEKAYQHQKLLYEQGATARLTYEKAESEYTQLKTGNENFEHIADAAEARIAILTKELDRARTAAQKKTEDMDSAKADLGSGEVHSPVDGLLLSRRGKAGASVTVDTPDLFVIATDLANLQVSLKPEPKLLATLKPGSPVLIDVTEVPGLIQGTVRESKDGEVLIDFQRPLPVVKPGLTVQVHIPQTVPSK